ncbi:ABC transporter ATP-binding protein [Falcatimonas sp. MSJ-15]|uniref:ABC transporter ATP-binding protein n=1 Tax=Falcatimonas sp. MSJ-15 TaxID=2841515 RepID=UPI001C1151E2|nr:ABC transporter ATP-binding protein [Falcatimonas sp. MSJ-15]MBU5470582.1 ABC transporter ATP-binding protein [Falcatimonas sp. MSJ-15]
MDVKEISFSYGKTKILDKISFSLKEGKITTIIGANGCGKSTLFKLMTRNLVPTSGKIVLGDKNIRYIPLKEFAKQVAIVHQSGNEGSDITVRQLVEYGRIPHRKISCIKMADDDKKIDWVISVTGLDEVKDRQINELSGGQRQRAFIAMALCQDTDILFLDEPTTYLDIRYQVEILELVKELNKRYGMTIAMILHDINQAVHYGDEIIGLKEGHILIQGKPKEVIDEEVIQKIYGIHLPVRQVDGDIAVLAVGKRDIDTDKQ